MLAVISRPVSIRQTSSIMDTHSSLVRVIAIALEKTHIVACNNRYVVFGSHLNTALHHFFFTGTPGANQLKIETITEYVLPMFKLLSRQRVITADHCPTDIALSTTRQSQQPCAGFLCQPFSSCHRFATNLPFEIATRNQL